MSAMIHTLWRMGFQACILILIVLAARQLLKKYSGLYTRLLWFLVLVRLLCPVFIATDFSLLPEFPVLRQMLGRSGISESPAGTKPEDNASQSVFASALPSANQLAVGLMQQLSAGAQNPQVSTSAADLPFSSGSKNRHAAGSRPASGALTGSGRPAALDGTLGIGVSLSPAHDSAQDAGNSRLPAHDGAQGTDDSYLPAQNGAGSTLMQKDIVSFLPTLLPALYLIGVLTTALIFLAQFLLLKRRISTAVCESGNIWLCENIASPFVIGIFSPRIILPYRIRPQAKAHILAHEQTHIRHRDPLLHFAGILCLCLHWWNPLVWLAVHKMNQDMEMFCDESTLRLADDEARKDYAMTLLSFAEYQSSLHAGPAFGESNTERRVKNIMKKRKKNFVVLGFVLLLAVFCAAAFMTIPKAGNKEGAPTENRTDNQGGSGSTPSQNPLAGSGQTISNHVIFEIDVPSALQNIFLFTPDFQSEEDLDAAFWKAYLFTSFTSLYGEEAEEFYDFTTVQHSAGQNGSDAVYNKIEAGKLDEMTKTLFGKAVSDFITDPYALTDGSDILYEDGSYYVRFSASADSSDFSLGIPTTIPMDDGTTILTFRKSRREDAASVTQVTLYLQPAETELGYILVGKQEQSPVSSDNPPDFLLSEEDIAALQRATLYMPDFSGEGDLNLSFWKDYFFHCYSKNFVGEKVNRYSKRRDLKTAYAKVSAETLDAEIRALFGKALSEYVPNPQDLSEEDGDIIYEDGNYYIRIPSNPRYVCEGAEVNAADGGRSTLTFYTRASYSAYPAFRTTLLVAPAENENGYILVGKKEEVYDFTSRALTGTWAVTSYFIPPNALEDGLSQEEIEQFVGIQLKFGADQLTVGKDTYAVSEYRKAPVTAEEFDDLFAPGNDILHSAATFQHYALQTAQGEQPFGSHVYRYDFEDAFVAHKGVLFRIVELTEDLDEWTVLDDYEGNHFAVPDENGFVEGPFVPFEMLPESLIYCTDDTHYIFVKGGISPEFDTQQKVDAFYAEAKKKTLESLQNGIHVLASETFTSDGMIATYDMYGGIMHTYPRDYPRKKLADGSFSWRYDDESCRAVVAGFDTAQPKLYYQAAGKAWEIYPLPGLENLTQEEEDSIVVAADMQKVVVTVTRAGVEIVRKIEVNQ